MSIKKTFALVGLMVFAVLTGAQTTQAGTCRDPWVDQAIREVSGREPNGSYESGECNIRNFNNASWGSYVELKRYVRGYFIDHPTYVQPTATVPLANTAYNQQQLASSIRHNPNSLIGHDGATLIGNAGGTLIGHDGATLIGDGGGTAVSKNSN